MTHTEQQLMHAMSAMDIIDCHEHLPAEAVRTGSPQDVFTLFSHYTRHDLYSAGLDAQSADVSPWSPDRPTYQGLFDPAVPVEKRWDTFEPFWNRIRFGSYARAAILTARMVYGVDEISRRTCRELSERIAAENTPGIYRRMLCDRCRIRVALTQNVLEGCEPPLVPVTWLPSGVFAPDPAALERLAQRHNMTVRTLEDYEELLRRQMDKAVAAGSVGIKMHAADVAPRNAKAAATTLGTWLAARGGATAPATLRPLHDYLTHCAIELAAERGLVVAVHAGIWGDFRLNDCKHLIPLAGAHPHARFDLYHLGMPFVRDAIVVARNLPNVFLNLCWTHIISQAQACSGIDEMLDQVPVNKVLAFGGDYARPVEKVVGHLRMAREDYARVLGARIDRGVLDMEDALHLLRLWFWDNPLALYSRLRVPAA